MGPDIHRTLHGGKKRLAGIFFFLITVIFGTALIADAQQDAGYVVSLRGDWSLNSSKRPHAGTPLRAGDILQVSNPGKGDYIEIANLSGRIIKNISCSEGGCDRPIKLTVAESGIVSRLVKAVMSILDRDPKNYEVMISRGGELREALVRITGEQVDLSSVLANKERDTYLLSFEPMKAGAPTLGPFRVDWNPEKVSPVVVKGLKPGLYVVRLHSNQDREVLEPGTEAWVLFAKPERFDKASSEFSESVALTNEWGEVRQSSKRQFLRATLKEIETKVR